MKTVVEFLESSPFWKERKELEMEAEKDGGGSKAQAGISTWKRCGGDGEEEEKDTQRESKQLEAIWLPVSGNSEGVAKV